MPVIYRTTDGAKWGAGKGADLTAEEIDGNFWDHEERLVDIETNPPTAVGISNIQVIGSTLMIYLDDGTEFGPYILPVAQLIWRGDWQPLTVYHQNDLVKVNGRGLYFVQLDHTSLATFDPEETNLDGDRYYMLTFGEDTYVYDFGFYYPGTPGFGIEVGGAMASHLLGRNVWLEIDLPGSLAKLNVDPAADLVFTLKKNATTIGTLTFTAGSTAGVFAVVARTQFTPGDMFRLVRPATLDTDAEELSVTILGIRGTIPA